MVGDFDGDGRDDLVNFSGPLADNAVHVAKSQSVVFNDGSTVNFFGPSLTWHDYFGLDREVPFGTVHCGGA